MSPKIRLNSDRKAELQIDRGLASGRLDRYELPLHALAALVSDGALVLSLMVEKEHNEGS